MTESPRDISKILANAYPDCSFLTNFLIRWRPYICPFHELIRSIPKSKSVLDVGCGIGLMSVLLSHLGKAKKVVGIDVSQKAIDTARSAVVPLDCDVTFEYLSKDKPWPDGDFDTIVSVDVLHHIPAAEQRDFIRRLAHTGFKANVVFKDISPKPFWKALANIAHDLLLSRQWTHPRSEVEVEKWLQEEGLSIVVSRRLDTLWYSHYLIVAKRGN